MKNIKVMTVVGTRPELIRLSRVISELDQYTNHTLVHTGQNYDYELNEIFFDDLNIRKPDYFLNCKGVTPMQTVGAMLPEVEKIIEKVKPDAFLVLGDTNSCLSTISAKRKKIPIFHMEAGNRCFDLRVPEETNRKIVDHISDINLPYSAIAREHLLAEGIAPNKIIVTGSPMNEVIDYYSEKIESSEILKKLKLNCFDYFLFSCHREENVDNEENLLNFINLLKKIHANFKKKIIVSLHPRTKKRLKQKKVTFDKEIVFLKPLSFTDYVNLQINALATMSDSGTISEESAILNFPALNIRESHERPEAMEEGSVMMVGLNISRVLQGLKILKNQKRGILRDLETPKNYTSNNVSKKVLRIIHSYIDYVNSKDWLK